MINKLTIKNNEVSFTGFEIPMETQYALLKKSNENLENELDEFVLDIKDVSNGHHLWITTWIPLRLDDLEGLALYYYISELIKYFKKTHKEEIIIAGEFDTYFKSYLKKNFPKVIVQRVRSKKYIKSRIRLKLSPLNYIFKTIFTKKNNKKIDARIWMSSPMTLEKHRYKHLLDKIDSKKAFFFSRLDRNINSNDKGVSINFLEYVSCKDVFASLKKAISLYQVKKRIKPKTLTNYAIKSYTLNEITGTLLKEISVKNAININNPKRILYITANTFSPARIVSRQAFLNNIPFTIVACRPMFTKARLEERLIKADLNKAHKAHVTDNYTVWDKYSKETLIEQGVEANRVYITSPPSKKNNASKKQRFKDSILVLFSHEEQLNQKLVLELKKIKTTKKIVIRLHPLKALTKEQHDIIYHYFDVIADITAKNYSNFNFINTIAITINSTALLEAVANGCAAAWLPYLNSRSLLFYEIMSSIGHVVKNNSELEKVLNKNETETILLIKKCHQEYLDKFKGKDQTEDFLKQMKLN